jgi:hypothetical protein
VTDPEFPRRVGLWGWLDARAERRERRQLLLIDKGLDWRSLFCQSAKGFDARLLIAFTIIGMFAWAYARENDGDTRKLMIGALIAAFAGAWGYYLGSSRSAASASDRADNAVALASQAVQALPAPGKPDVTLAPGETAQAEPQPEA